MPVINRPVRGVGDELGDTDECARDDEDADDGEPVNKPWMNANGS
jgi:hypothetical protein